MNFDSTVFLPENSIDLRPGQKRRLSNCPKELRLTAMKEASDRSPKSVMMMTTRTTAFTGVFVLDHTEANKRRSGRAFYKCIMDGYVVNKCNIKILIHISRNCINTYDTPASH